MDVSVSTLRGFLAVADELHFGRAAERLFLSTSALSQMISRLERQLGVTLFNRSPRNITLTATGVALRPLARDTVDSHDRMVAWARRFDRNIVRIGFTHVGPPALLGGVFTAASGQVDLSLEYRHVRREEVPDLLAAGDIDVAFLWGPHRFYGVRTRHLWEESRSLLVNVDSNLAQHDTVSIDEVRDPFVVPGSPDNAFVAWALVDPRPDGSAAVRGPAAHDLDEALALVATGRGVHVVPDCVARSVNHDGVRSIPLTGVSQFPYLLAHRDAALPEHTARFVALVLEIAATMSATTVRMPRE